MSHSSGPNPRPRGALKVSVDVHMAWELPLWAIAQTPTQHGRREEKAQGCLTALPPSC